MRVLVTGAAGFIGFHLSRALLARGDEVVGVDNLNDYYQVSLKEARLEILNKIEGFTFHKLDIADYGPLSALFDGGKFDCVVNLAAQAGVRYSIENPMAYGKANLQGFMNILECCRLGGVGHLVYASSSSVYGNNEKVPFSETDRVDHPISFYAATKASNELMAHTFGLVYGMPITGLRFFTVYGPYGRPDMAYFKFSGKILAGEEIEVYNHGKLWRDFTYVDDIISGVVKSIDTPQGVRLINLGNSKTVSLESFIEVLEDHLGVKAVRKNVGKQKGDVDITHADISVAKSLLGWEPTTNIEEGLGKFVEWYKDYYKV